MLSMATCGQRVAICSLYMLMGLADGTSMVLSTKPLLTAVFPLQDSDGYVKGGVLHFDPFVLIL